MKEIFNTYAKLYVTHADMPLLDFEGFEKATIAWEEKKREGLQTEIDKFLKEPREYKRFSFDWVCQWDSFIFWRKMNWRNFSWITINTETNCYSKYLELEFIVLGLGFYFDWYRPFETDKEILDRIDN